MIEFLLIRFYCSGLRAGMPLSMKLFVKQISRFLLDLLISILDLSNFSSGVLLDESSGIFVIKSILGDLE
jgi:hypothetical protein